MIPGSLYPTTGSYNVGFSGNEYQITYTDTANSSSISWDGSMDAYALGYINPDQLPNSMAISQVFITEEENVDDRNIVIQRISPSSNAIIGYAMKSDIYTSYYRKTDGVATSGNLSGMRFVNNFFPEFMATRSQVTLYIKWFLTVPGSSEIKYFSDSPVVSFDGDTTYYSWLQFKDGATITKNFTSGGDDYGDIEYTYSDFNKGRYSGTTSTGAQISGFCIGFSFPSTSFRSGYSDGNINYAFAPLLNYSGTYAYGEISGDVEQTYCRLRSNNTSTHSGIALYQFNYNSGQGRLTNINLEDGYGDDLLNVGQLKSSFTNASIYTHIYTDETLIVKEDLNPQVTLFPLRRFEEIDEAFALYSRFTSVSSPPASYRENMTYCCDVNSANLFSIHFKTGDITDPAFKNTLQPWQYVDRDNPDPDDNGTENTNDFDPTDPSQLPPYTPEPEPEPENPDDPNENPIDDNPEAGPDKNNRGKRFTEGSIDKNDYPADPSPFVKYGLFDYDDLIVLSGQLWNKPTSFFEALSAGQEVNPMDYFISLRWYPFPFETTDTKIKNELFLGHGGRLFVSYNEFRNNISVINFGSLKVKPFYNNFLDYLPYTKVYLFLPYCGQLELNPTVVMDKTITLKAAVDISDGSIVYQLWNDTDGQPLLIKQARVGAEIPITSINAAQMGSNIVNATLSAVNQVSKTAGDVKAGISKGMEAGGAIAGPEGAVVGSLLGGVLGAASNTTNLISTFSNLGMASKEIVQLSGGSTGIASSGVQIVPYLIYQRPLATNPSTYGHTTGWLCNKAATISSMSGFTICKNVDTSNIPQATEKEKAQIKKILDSGFYAN